MCVLEGVCGQVCPTCGAVSPGGVLLPGVRLRLLLQAWTRQDGGSVVQGTEMVLIKGCGSALISAPIKTDFTGDDGFCPVCPVNDSSIIDPDMTGFTGPEGVNDWFHWLLHW